MKVTHQRDVIHLLTTIPVAPSKGILGELPNLKAACSLAHSHA